MKSFKKYSLLAVLALGLGVGGAISIGSPSQLGAVQSSTAMAAAKQIQYDYAAFDSVSRQALPADVTSGLPTNITGTPRQKIDLQKLPELVGYKIDSVNPDGFPLKSQLIKGYYKQITATSTINIKYIDAATGDQIGKLQPSDAYKYNESGKLTYKLPEKAIDVNKVEVKTPVDGLELDTTSDKTTLGVVNHSEAGGTAEVDVYVNMPKQATVNINYLDEKGNPIVVNDKPMTKTISDDTTKIGNAFSYDDVNSFTNDSWNYTPDHYTVNGGAIQQITDGKLNIDKLAETNDVNVYFKKDVVAKSDKTNVPGVYAEAGAKVALDANHYTIVSAGAGVGILGATAHGEISFSGPFGLMQWKVGAQVYVGPLGVWVVAGITPDKKVVVTPLSVDAHASAAVAGVDTALSAGATANASVANGSGASAAAGITTPTTTTQKVVSTGNEKTDTPSGTVPSVSKQNIIGTLTDATIKAANGIVNAVSGAIHSVLGWIF
ncbi:hypothetical protein ACNAN0_04435 [Agrilactobacillus fermenti]|uniref:hypothetical protein n=1 Tax=Agrilactobacillus fermenti TaxID=2586909 RepID=UPI001E2C2497|nr:hypothetical protein [Agrilactobacillus fermenti]MCD2256271.1 hypothetical protein [Agrilactobacillus fermenti]